MKALITITLITLFTSSAFAADYTPITKDNEVTTVEQVQIKEVVPVTQERTWSLAAIDAEIAQTEKNIAHYQAQITQWQGLLTQYTGLRAMIEAEAKKVELKKVELKVAE